MTDPRKFILNSDYPMDKIAWVKEGVLTLTPGAFVTSIPHGLPFTPLINGSWSLDPDFSLAKPIGELLLPPPDVDYLYAEADSTNFYVGYMANSTTATPVYYRFFAFAPSNYSGQITPPDISTGFRFNSDLKYMKLFKEGIVDVPTDSASPAVNIAHNLGYVPMVKIWSEAGGLISPFMADGGENGILYVNVDQNNVTFYSQSFYNKFHYRIYADD